MISTNNPPNYFPIINSGSLYVDGLQTVQAGLFQQYIEVGQARDSTNSNDIIVPNRLTINIDSIGPNGLDNGIISPQTFYGVYVIGDSTKSNPTAGLLSLNYNSSPVMPFGYDLFRRIGWMLTNSTIQAQTERLWTMGTDKTRTYYYDTGPVSVLTGGNATSPAQVSMAGVVPIAYAPQATNLVVEAYCRVTYSSASSANTVSFGISTSINLPIVSISNGAVATTVSNIWLPVRITNTSPPIPAIQYKTTSASDSVSLAVFAFRDYL